MNEQSTIVAIATGVGGGIGVVRLSGAAAFAIADKIFAAKRPVSEMAGYTGQLGKVHYGGEALDEAILFAFRAPHSYTGEDVCEISCHGGACILNRVVEAAIANGAVPAGPGEFTKRAFLNGKMTLTQAEGVAALVAGESRQAVRAALAAYDGALFRRISEVTGALLEAGAHITAWIDFPEEDVEELLAQQLAASLRQAQEKLADLVNSYNGGRMLREGISTVLVGSPNVGKSTLMNLLAGQERSIVTQIPGTTRDVVEERIQLGDIILNLADTAGIRNSVDPVEQLGVARSLSKLEQCDLVLAVFDGARELSEGDILLLERLDGRLAIAVLNKSDLPQKADLQKIAAHTCTLVELSAKEGSGVERLAEEIARLVGINTLDPGSGLLQNQRQLACVVAAIQSLEEAQQALGVGQTLDIVSMSIEEATGQLLELTGKKASAEIIDKVFENFCVGK